MTDLENLLRGSLEIKAMRAAIEQALPLMREERDANTNAAAYAKTHSSYTYTILKLEADADRWTAAVAGLEEALQPAEVVGEIDHINGDPHDNDLRNLRVMERVR